MHKTAVHSKIHQTVQAALPGAKVLLFGSQARGTQDRCSDYDLLIITPTTLSSREKIAWHTRLDHAIVKAIHAPVDLLFNSDEEICEKARLPGHIIRSALKEGILL